MDSSMDTLRLLGTLSYAARTGFVGGSTTSYWPWLNIALLLSALCLSLWGLVLARWGKYAQPTVILRSSVSFSSEHHTTNDQSSSAFSCGYTTTSRNLNIADLASTHNWQGGRIYMQWNCPIDEFVRKEGTTTEGTLGSGKSSLSSDLLSNFMCGDKCNGTLFLFDHGQEQIVVEDPSFSDVCVSLFGERGRVSDLSFERQYGWDKLEALKLGFQWTCSTSQKFGLNLGCPSYFVNGSLQSSKGDVVKYSDIWYSRNLSANTGLVCRDIEESKLLGDSTVVIQNSSEALLLSGIVINENKSSLYVWDPRNCGKPESFSLGNELAFQSYSLRLNDTKVCVCDGLKKRVFDLRMVGAVPVEIYPNMQRNEVVLYERREWIGWNREFCN